MTRALGPLALALLVVACGPIGPFPGGPLQGDEATESIDDWSFAADYPQIQLETRPDSSPYSVNVWCMVHDGQLYVPSGKPEGKRWVKNVLEEDRVRVRAWGDVYRARALRVTDPAERETVKRVWMDKYNVPDPDASGSERVVWFFRIDSRD